MHQLAQQALENVTEEATMALIRRIGAAYTPRLKKRKMVVYAKTFRRGRPARPVNYLPFEKKFLDTERAAETLGTSWGDHSPATIECLNAMALEHGESNRVGRVVYIHSLFVHGAVKALALEASTTPREDIIIRIVIYIDKHINNTATTVASVIDTGGSDDINGFRNLFYTGRIQVLFDKTIRITFPGQTNEGGVNSFASPEKRIQWKYFHRFRKPLKTTFTLDTGVVAAISDSAIQVMAISTEVNSQILYQSRIRFTDA